jgi:hypothetical protein
MINYGALAGRPHGGRPTVPILLSEADRAAIAAAMRPARRSSASFEGRKHC